MRAAVISSPGGPEVIKIAEVDPPSPQPGEVTIDVAWAGVNFLDVMQRRGTYAGDGPFICGAEVAGHIRQTGPDVEGLTPGEAVVAFTSDGGYAEVASARAEHVVALRGEFSAVGVREAACAPIVGVSAVALLDRIATVHDGDIVLVNAAAGGMGSVLARLARHLGAAQVIGTVGSDAKIPVARGFGYDHVVLRDQLHERLPAIAPDGIDVALDPVGGTAFRQGLEALRPLGRLIRYGNASGAEDEPLATLGLVYANRTIGGFSLRGLADTRPDAYRALLGQALELIVAGVIPIEISGEYALAQASDVHRRLEAGQTTGKLVIAPSRAA